MLILRKLNWPDTVWVHKLPEKSALNYANRVKCWAAFTVQAISFNCSWASINITLDCSNLFWTIAGLDPAGPCFTFPCSADLDSRLDESDALYVQCIHTNIGLLGQSPRCGCHDFYVNQGIFQPGGLLPIYAHFFACEIFDWALDVNNKCYSTIGEQLIGIHNINRRCGQLQLNTEAKAPFCSRRSGKKRTERIT